MLQQIVTADSAGLNEVRALPMGDVDHRNICKFPNDSHPGYGQIVKFLLGLKGRIVASNEPGVAPLPQVDQEQRMRSQRVANDDARDDLFRAQNQVTDAEGQRRVSDDSAGRTIRAGEGEGGRIVRGANSVTIGGGRATGASMSLKDL
jgi:hypothetical protein